MEDIRKLLKTNTDPNVRDRIGNTALHILAMRLPFFIEIAHILMCAGAQIDVPNDLGKTFIDMVEDFPEIQPLIEKMRDRSLLNCVARSIILHKVPYKGRIGKILEQYLDEF